MKSTWSTGARWAQVPSTASAVIQSHEQSTVTWVVAVLMRILGSMGCQLWVRDSTQ
jgi:hypothetical protein